MNEGILLIECPDQPGLISKITIILSGHAINLTEFHEFADRRFYMRANIVGDFKPQRIANHLRCALPVDSTVKITNKERKKVVIMVTKESHCLGDILLRHFTKDIDMDILAVIGNHDDCAELTKKFNIPWYTISHNDFSRKQHEKRVMQKIKELKPDYIILAKFMRILTPKFVEEFPNKIINIHHSFLPAFVGAKPYHQAYDRGVKIVGATAHFVTNDLDQGPIIYQDVINVNHSHSAIEMSRAGKDVEKDVLTNAIKLVLKDRVFVKDNRTIVFN